MKNLYVCLVSLFTAGALSACGGGGGPDNAAVPAPLPTAAVIDSGNAMAVAGATAEVALGTDDLGGIAGFTGLTLSVPGGINKSGGIVASAKLAQGGLGLINFVPIGPETQLCTIRGSVTVSGNLADPTTISVNDEIRADSDNCEDEPGVVVDGLLEITITNIDGDILTSDLVLLSVELVATGFSVTENGAMMTATGDIGVTADNRTPPVVEGRVFGDRFSVTSMGRTDTLKEYLTIYTEDTSTFPVMWTNNAMGKVESSDFSGEVTYETPVTFAGLGENYPYVGELLITGANGGTLLLRTINDQDVEIEANYDGLGDPDETIVTTWAELDP